MIFNSLSLQKPPTDAKERQKKLLSPDVEYSLAKIVAEVSTFDLVRLVPLKNFNFVIDAIVGKAFEDRSRVQYNVNNFLTINRWWCYIHWHRCRGPQHPLPHHPDSYGLRISVAKTKVMDGSHTSLCLSGVQIEQVQEIKYLGLLMHLSLKSTAELAKQK